MTLQDLKTNREIILKQMSFIGVKENMTKEFMKTMVDFVELDLNEDEDVVSFVNQVFGSNKIKWQGKKEKFSLRETVGGISEQMMLDGYSWDNLNREWIKE